MAGNAGNFGDPANFVGGDAAGVSQGVPDIGVINRALCNRLANYQNTVVAFAGGGQASATQIIAENVEVSTCASGADSVKLPPANPGDQVYIQNNGAQSLQVFAYETSGTTINGTAGSTGVAQANGKAAMYFCVKAGVWYRILSA